MNLKEKIEEVDKVLLQAITRISLLEREIYTKEQKKEADEVVKRILKDVSTVVRPAKKK